MSEYSPKNSLTWLNPVRPVGTTIVSLVGNIWNEIKPQIQTTFKPYEDVYRVSDSGDYITAQAWNTIFSKYDKTIEIIYLLVNNYIARSEDLANLTPQQIISLFEQTQQNDPDAFNIVFFTEANDTGEM